MEGEEERCGQWLLRRRQAAEPSLLVDGMAADGQAAVFERLLTVCDTCRYVVDSSRPSRRLALYPRSCSLGWNHLHFL